MAATTPTLRISTWLPPTELPTNQEAETEDYVMLIHLEDAGVVAGYYVPRKNQFFQHCQRYSTFDAESIDEFTTEDEINNDLEWESEEVYPKGHKDAGWSKTILNWMLVPAPPRAAIPPEYLDEPGEDDIN